tara:strand:+ start:910 stop:1689 length:780 start_codon:yes stop_codon:yes gene_type:complete
MKDRLQSIDIRHIGTTAENLVMAKLASMRNEVMRTPEHHVYDLQNLNNDCKIEVKSTNIDSREGPNVAFRLSERQFNSNDIDYIVALVFHETDNIFNFDAYIIPHKVVKYISSVSRFGGAKRAGYGDYNERAFTFSIDGKHTRQPYVANLGKNKWNLLTSKKATMTRNKNKLIKQMITKFKRWYLIDNPNVKHITKETKTGHKNWYKCIHCQNKPVSRCDMRTHLERVHGLNIMKDNKSQEVKHYKRVRKNGKFVKGRH